MIGTRLKEERERLDLTQPAFALIAGASKRTLVDWEQGKTSPNAVQLSALSAAGVDIQYVVTGIRATLDRPPPGRVEEKIIVMLQDMPDDQKRDVLKYAEEKKLLVECLADRGAGKRNKKRAANEN